MKQRNRRRAWSVSQSIVVSNALFILVSASIMLYSMWMSSERNSRELSGALIAEIEHSVNTRIVNYFSPAESVNTSIAFMLTSFITNPLGNKSDEAALFAYFRRMGALYPQFKMMYFADTEGNLIMLHHMEDGTFSHRVVRNTGATITITWTHDNPDNGLAFPDTTEPAETGYDPRNRLWYTLAKTRGAPVWTPVYLFATDHLPGMTSAFPLYRDRRDKQDKRDRQDGQDRQDGRNGRGRQDGQDRRDGRDGDVDVDGKEFWGICAIDIAVNQLSRFLGTIAPTEGTRIILLNAEQDVVAVQARKVADLDMLYNRRFNQEGNAVYQVTNITDFADPLIRDLTQKARSPIAPKGTAVDQGFRLLRYRDERFLTAFSPVMDAAGLDLVMGIIIPETDILGNVRRNLFSVTLFLVVMLGIILCVSSLLARAIAEPLQKLSNEMAKIRRFDLDSTEYIDTDLIEIRDMNESFDGMRKGLRNFKRYVPSDLVAMLINKEIEASIGGERRELTVFFSDIAHFTSISERTPPEQLMQDMQVYFELVSKTILGNQGTIDKYIGDAVMAFWGAPRYLENHAALACRSAILIRNLLHSLSRQWEDQGKSSYVTRIGIHTGEAIVGNMGYNERLNYTVIGDTVNAASRLEGINKIYGTSIIVSQSTYEQCGHLFEFRHLDRTAVVGRSQAFEIYELLTFRDNLDPRLDALFRRYEAGLRHYVTRQWAEAIRCFAEVLAARPVDVPSGMMLQRCEAFRRNPPPEDWNGVFVQSAK